MDAHPFIIEDLSQSVLVPQFVPVEDEEFLVNKLAAATAALLVEPLVKPLVDTRVGLCDGYRLRRVILQELQLLTGVYRHVALRQVVDLLADDLISLFDGPV